MDKVSGCCNLNIFICTGHKRHRQAHVYDKRSVVGSLYAAIPRVLMRGRENIRPECLRGLNGVQFFTRQGLRTGPHSRRHAHYRVLDRNRGGSGPADQRSTGRPIEDVGSYERTCAVMDKHHITVACQRAKGVADGILAALSPGDNTYACPQFQTPKDLLTAQLLIARRYGYND